MKMARLSGTKPPYSKTDKSNCDLFGGKLTFSNQSEKNRQGGSMKGEVWISDQFNEPLDDLNEYM
ncbi:hypothetical protein SD10_00075 [Spirosoma radiotolerans]|uniref:DUF2281 domain-containing protein n=1 Tax=Spirosoma radiotolerans TaxID=1379870 RepID=A0A0E3ZT11_9BACT|nr:hypothetical protein SD10_00075 [Spirosoma radiotolerans]